MSKGRWVMRKREQSAGTWLKILLSRIGTWSYINDQDHVSGRWRVTVERWIPAKRDNQRRRG